MKTAWFVEASVGKCVMFLTEQGNFTFDMTKARMFPSEHEATVEFESDPHFGDTPDTLKNMACSSWMRRRYPEHEFRSVRLDVEDKDFANGRLFSIPDNCCDSRRTGLFRLPGLRRLADLFSQRTRA